MNTWIRDSHGSGEGKEQLRDHGISFETATEIFSDPNLIVRENYFLEDQGEQRYGVIGLAFNVVLLLVVYVDRSEADVEVIRIISARKANEYEQVIYTQQLG